MAVCASQFKLKVYQLLNFCGSCIKMEPFKKICTISLSLCQYTDELRELADGEDMEVNVTIDEDEYQKACIELIQGTQGDLALLCLTQFLANL